VNTPAPKRNEVQKYLAAKFEAALRVTPEEVTAALSTADGARAKGLNDRITALVQTRRIPGKIQALYDVGTPPPTYLLKRGNYETPGEEVQPGFLRALTDPAHPGRLTTSSPFGASSGRRRALARWLTAADSRPADLLARVMVNRLWQHLFGKGLVPSAGNFGRTGQPPTHPELLEWLGREFVRSNWRVKPMLRLLMTSTAYRQTSRSPGTRSPGQDRPASERSPHPEAIDPGNRLLWRMRLRRLEAEVIRDALLAVSGRLAPVMSGPPVMLRVREDGLVDIDEKALRHPADRGRRSVYLLCRRSYNLSLLTVFDQPLVALNCPRRDVSAVPLQSLSMLNDAFVADQARHFAARVTAMAGPGDDQAIRAAFRLALARPPAPPETAICRRLLSRQTAAYRDTGKSAGEAQRLALGQLCLTLLNTSEFLYVE
jgi:hypothetical protein